MARLFFTQLYAMVTRLYAQRSHAALIERIDAHYKRKGARMYKKAIIASTAIALSIGASVVRAQSVDSAWYGGIDLGRSRLGFEERPADRRRGDVRPQPQRVRQGRLGPLRADRQRRHRQGPRRRVLDWSRLPVLRKEERGRSRGGEWAALFHFSRAGESIVG